MSTFLFEAEANVRFIDARGATAKTGRIHTLETSSRSRVRTTSEREFNSPTLTRGPLTTQRNTLSEQLDSVVKLADKVISAGQNAVQIVGDRTFVHDPVDFGPYGINDPNSDLGLAEAQFQKRMGDLYVEANGSCFGCEPNLSHLSLTDHYLQSYGLKLMEGIKPGTYQQHLTDMYHLNEAPYTTY